MATGKETTNCNKKIKKNIKNKNGKYRLNKVQARMLQVVRKGNIWIGDICDTITPDLHEGTNKKVRKEAKNKSNGKKEKKGKCRQTRNKNSAIKIYFMKEISNS